MNLLRSNSDFFSEIPKAKTAKIVRNILDIVAQVPNSEHVQITLCRDVVEWCKAEKRTFLRQRIEARVRTVLEFICLSLSCSSLVCSWCNAFHKRHSAL